MRKVYVLLGTQTELNYTRIVGVYSSFKKAKSYLSTAKDVLKDTNKFEIKTEVLI